MTRPLHWKSVASLVLQVAALAALLAVFFIRMPEVSGLSMEPHIASGEFVLINTVAYRFGSPLRGDVVAFRHDTDQPEIYIKRVIGVPGDRVRVEGGAVYVNDRRLVESYVQYADNRSYSAVTVPARSLYVLGDNRADSEDSRFWGFVSYDQVIGKALAGIWPIGRAGKI